MNTAADRYEDIILSVTIASAERPTKVLSVWRDSADFWSGWAERVTHLAVVERRYYTRPVDELPGDPRQRRRFLQESERSLQPVIHDVNAITGFATLAELRDMAMPTERFDVVTDDVEWETVMQSVQSAQSLQRAREAKAKATAA